MGPYSKASTKAANSKTSTKAINSEMSTLAVYTKDRRLLPTG